MKLPDHLRLVALDPSLTTEAEFLDDIAREVAMLHDLPEGEARDRFTRFLAVYHDGTEPMAEGEAAQIAGGEVEHSFIRLSKPYRFLDADVLPAVLAAIPRFLQSGNPHPAILDFGGGGGTDAIVYARNGFEAHYADLLSLKATDVVVRRFELRGLDVPVWNALQLPSRRWDVITAIDVLEHIYDVEQALAALLSRIEPGGLFCCVNAFGAIDYDGDHLDKNRVYLDVFPYLMTEAGFERVHTHDPLEIFRLPAGAATVDEGTLRRRLYGVTHERALAACKEFATQIAHSDVDWRAFELDGPVVGTTQVPADSRHDAKTVAVRLAKRYAPGSLRRLARRVRSRSHTVAVQRPKSGAEAVTGLADWLAVLRISTARLRRA
jgi:hypothetical protein